MYTEMQNLLSQKWRIAAALALNIVKFTVVYSIPLLALRALGCVELKLYPLAGAGVAGVADSGRAAERVRPWADGPRFRVAVRRVRGENTVSAALVLYRAATYFTPFVVSLPTVLIGQRRASGVRSRRRTKTKRNN